MASTDVFQEGEEDTGSALTKPKQDQSKGDGENEKDVTNVTNVEKGADGGADDAMAKHPLQYRWVLWYCKHDRNKEWEDCLKEVASFDTVEDFWALYNNIQLASGLSWGSDYYLFKEGIRPMWEDPNNIEGGRWLIQVDKTRRNDLLDHYWLELLMAVVGEQFDGLGEFVCGAVVNVRQKGDKVSLWTKDSTMEKENCCIGEIAKRKLGITDTIVFENHKDSQRKSGSTVKARLRV